MPIPTTDSEIIEAGRKAQMLLENNDFRDLVKLVEESMTNDFFYTQPGDGEKRENLFSTFHGLRTFIERLADIRQAKDEILRLRDEDAMRDSDDTD